MHFQENAQKKRKFDLERGSNVYDIFNNHYPPNCMGIEELIAAVYYIHPNLEKATMRIGLGTDHSFFEVTSGPQAKWDRFDVIGVNTLKVSAISPEMFRSYRYSLGRPYYLPESMVQHAIWNFLSFDTLKGKINTWKQYLNSFRSLDLDHEVCLHTDSVLDPLFDHVLEMLDADSVQIVGTTRLYVRFMISSRKLSADYKQLVESPLEETLKDLGALTKCLHEFFESGLLWANVLCEHLCTVTSLSWLPLQLTSSLMSKCIVSGDPEFSVTINPFLQASTSFVVKICAIAGHHFRTDRGLAVTRGSSGVDTLLLSLNKLILKSTQYLHTLQAFIAKCEVKRMGELLIMALLSIISSLKIWAEERGSIAYLFESERDLNRNCLEFLRKAKSFISTDFSDESGHISYLLANEVWSPYQRVVEEALKCVLSSKSMKEVILIVGTTNSTSFDISVLETLTKVDLAGRTRRKRHKT